MVNDDTPKPQSAESEDTAALAGSPTIFQGPLLLKERYRLIRELSTGGFGSVYLAHDQQMHGRPVVVKIQNARMADDPWFERKFNEEVRALSMIDHPGVVVAIDSGRTPEGKPFLVMQYVEGITLRAVMSPEGMPLERAAEILKQVGRALGAAHDKGIWHRDLKPENLMLEPTTSGERVRLIDFGIATIADRKGDETNTRVAGSVLYMAPEQRLGQPSALTDIYAMGLIAYEMVTGRKPFMAENFVQLDALQCAGLRIKPSDLRPGLTLAAERLIQRSLEYEPSKRPQDAREFGDQLYGSLMESDATAVVSTKRSRTSGNRKFWMAGSIALAMVAVAAGLYTGLRSWSWPKSKTEPPAQSEATVKDAASEQAIELAFWNSVKDATEPQLFREYLSTYPQGRFRSLAQAKLEILARKQNAKPNPAQPPARVKENNEAQEQEVELMFWNSVKDATEPQLYRDYLEKYPHGRFESVARTKLDILSKRAERDPARAQHRRSIPDMPGLGNLDIAPPRMSPELTDFLKLRETKNPQAYRDYLAKYPNGNFATVVRIKLADLENGPPKDPAQSTGPSSAHPRQTQ